MHKTRLLLTRLDEIGQSLAQRETALALIGLGSVGQEVHRLDEFSDLDFFVIVRAGAKAEYLSQLDWLSSIRPIVYQFRNTADGYKLLFDDDVFCEFAVFAPEELANIPFAAGRVVWKRAGVDAGLALPALRPTPRAVTEPDWLLGEALTNLYVGLGRYLRGEKLSAARFIQQHAVDRVLELSAALEAAQPSDADPFVPERRYERRFPQTARQLSRFVQGYERSPQSAEAILEFLVAHWEVNAHLAQRIRDLAQRARDSS